MHANCASSGILSHCVALFDIDGTLITGPAGGPSPGVIAMDTAAIQLTGQPNLHDQVEFAGRTDRQIARDLLLAGGHQHPSEGDITRLIEIYIEVLSEGVKLRPYRAIGDVRCAVESLRAAGCTVGLGTGNMVRGAGAKLASAGLLDAFDLSLGGFADDAEPRDDVLRAGAKRCDPSGEKVIVVIGDTPHDVHAAMAINALCLAVTTGCHDEPTLRREGAHEVVDRLDGTTVDTLAAMLRRR